jgi:hypothetical protein
MWLAGCVTDNASGFLGRQANVAYGQWLSPQLICPTLGQIARSDPCVKKKFCFHEIYLPSVFRKNMVFLASSRLDEEGRSANRHQTLCAGCDGCDDAARRAAIVACGKGVWS